jgi:hypothetical protein
MTLDQFREATKDMPGDMDLFIAERKTEFQYGLVNDVYRSFINFSEGNGSRYPSAKAEVIVIDEE